MAVSDISSLLDELEASFSSKTITELPEEVISFLPPITQDALEKFEKINGKLFLPKEDVDRLTLEAEKEKMGQLALRNDPHGRGFHGGDPELGVAVTDDPMEIRGREFRGPYDKYGSKPDVFRTFEPQSIIQEKKYKYPTRANQYRVSDTPNTSGMYRAYDDTMILRGTGDKPFIAREIIEPHEYMHRGLSHQFMEAGIIPTLMAGVDFYADLAGLPEIFNTMMTTEAQHEYIDEAISKYKKKRFMENVLTDLEVKHNEALDDLKMDFIIEYNSSEIGTEKFNEYMTENNLSYK
tara:strand:+ start:287 stop:1168 length:882 start_codon:yes stop_codon:yes gene_type:complete